jgi:hypothetical protein
VDRRADRANSPGRRAARAGYAPHHTLLLYSAGAAALLGALIVLPIKKVR